MRDKSKVVRTALRAAKRRRYDIGGIADPYGMMETEEELRKKNPLYQNTGDLSFLNPHPYDPAKDPTTLGPNTNAGQLGTGLPNGLGGALTPTSTNFTTTTPATVAYDPRANDMLPYSNANYQPGAVQSFSLAPPANTVDPFSANITGALAGIPTTPSSTTRGLDLTPSTPAQVAALNVATNPNQMFTDSGKITSQAGQQLPGFLGPERAAFEAESKALMAAYGNLADTLAANQTATPTAAEVDQSLPGAVTGQNLVGSFDPLASQDVLGDVSHGTFGLSGPMGLSNAMQETNEQVDAQEAEQAAAEQAAAEQAAAAEAENAGGGDGDAPEGGGGVPEGGGGPDEKRGGRIHMRHKYALDGVVDDILARKQESMDPRKALMFGETDQALPPTGLPIGQTVGTKAAVDVAKGLMDASDLTRQAMQGALPPDYFHSDEGIGRALNAAGIGMAGGVAGVPARAGETVLGSGPVRKALDVANQAAYERQLTPLGFYSRGAETAAGLQQAKGTPEQFRSMLEKAGVKPVEMEGFDKAFAGKPSVTREELTQHFNERMPQVEETVLGGKLSKEEIARLNELDAKRTQQNGLNLEENNEYNLLYQKEGKLVNNRTKFGQYTLPGGENYREVLLRLPENKGGVKGPKGWGDIGGGTSDTANFRSQHWDDPNVLAHIRMANRTGPNGEKILHVEEIQSDWGQKGRDEGFSDPKALAQWATDIEAAKKVLFKAQEQHAEVVDRIRLLGEPLEPFKRGVESPREFQRREAEHFNKRDALLSSDPDYRASRQRLDAAKDAIRAIGPEPSAESIPNAPYVTNTQAWTDLALKRALKEAAEGGYDKLVWTPGAEQAKRYPDGGVKREEGMIGYYDKIVPNQLSKLVKKLDPEAKLSQESIPVNKAGWHLTDPERTVSGKWMVKSSDYNSKGMHFDTETEARAALAAKIAENSVTTPSLTITPKMREAIMKGQTAYKNGGSIIDKALMLTSRRLSAAKALK